MRILFVNPTSDLYGASRSLVRLASALAASGHSVLVIVPEQGPLIHQLREQGILVRICPFLTVIRRRVLRSPRILLFMLSVIPSILYILYETASFGAQIVHTNSGVVFVAAISAWISRRKHVWHIRETFYDQFPLLWMLYRRLIQALSSVIVCVSQPVACQFRATQNLIVVHNGLDLREFQIPQAEVQERRRAYCSQPASTLTGVVGRISSWKGQDVFLAACAHLKELGRRGSCYLVMGDPYVGNEHLLHALRRYVLDNGMEGQVVFTGFIDDPRPVIAAMDLLVVPSVRPDPFPGIVLEAMALGVPVIATNIGGTVEQIEDSETGMLLPPGDVDALADAMRTLLDDPTLRRRMGEAGRRRVESLFSLDAMSQKIQAIYEQIARE